eukprot:TRINITY_DN57774_c0_g1_i1.p1 TRINITY_DN57774_c0_g1~~TRINITY_DN57774_c0_g1_i1.p1  ORF type:complete len:472 (+),score=64.44 TRINITY_DN57774_c0_g1_i1:151-1566(+)
MHEACQRALDAKFAHGGYTFPADVAAGAGGPEHFRWTGSSTPTSITPSSTRPSSPCRRQRARTPKWREEQAIMQHTARLARHSSEGNIKGLPVDQSVNGSKGVSSTTSGFAKRSNRTSVMLQEKSCGTPRESRASVGACGSRVLTPPPSALRRNASARLTTPRSECGLQIGQPSKADALGVASSPSSRKEQDLYGEVSSLVKELETARSQAASSGGFSSRALETAVSALEPLLRMRDVTGAFACDLSVMPWLPQLLSVFRYILHSAAEGTELSPRMSRLTNADCGAGGAGACTNIAAALSVAASLGSRRVGSDSASVSELETLRGAVEQHKAELCEYELRETRLRQELQDAEREREELRRRVWDLESGGKVFGLPSSNSPRSMCSTDMDAQWLVRRVTELERENFAWRSEIRTTEERVGELVGIVQAAVEDEGDGTPSQPYPRTRKTSRQQHSGRDRRDVEKTFSDDAPVV